MERVSEIMQVGIFLTSCECTVPFTRFRQRFSNLIGLVFLSALNKEIMGTQAQYINAVLTL
jgi:hypothetical protein